MLLLTLVLLAGIVSTDGNKIIILYSDISELTFLVHAWNVLHGGIC